MKLLKPMASATAISMLVVVAMVAMVTMATVAFAGAREDVRIETKRDAERNTIYLLTNRGSRTVVAKVQMMKDCTGNRQKPRVKTFWVSAGKSTQIARAWAETSCRHDYRILEAKYP